ncbi:MAG: DUF4178 domain-containing protein [Pseudomonadota bacterium]
MTGHVTAIDCPNCGAGLPVLGGGRVVTKVCTYCGASLDAANGFKVLEVYADLKRPPSPFRLGMTGLVDGIEFTIIGTLGKSERYGGQTWTWVDHQLYSPTHGYAWLTVEDGHTLLTRKVRDWPSGAFLTTRAVDRAETRPVRSWRGRSFTYYAYSNWHTDFVEGEFNWRPKRGAKGATVSLLNNGDDLRMLAYADDGAEREVEVTRYFPEAAAAFGVEPLEPWDVHPLQPYAPLPKTRFNRLWYGGLVAASIGLALFLTVASGPRETLFDGPPSELAAPLTFDVEDASRPVRIGLQQNLQNDWAEFELAIRDPEGVVLAETFRGISYYSGSSGGESWSEGSRRATIGFAPTTPGAYSLAVTPAQGGQPGTMSRSQLRVTVQSGYTRPLWLWLAAGAFGLMFLWALSSKFRHRAARWKGSDWSEDDD